MADQLRYDVISPKLTPNIWNLKEKGLDFTNAYTACPLCVPSRGAFFTGTYPNRNGSLINPWVEEDKEYGNVKVGIDNLYEMMCQDWDVIHSGKQHLFTEGSKLEDRKDTNIKFVSTEATYLSFLEENGKKRPGGMSFKSAVPEMVAGKRTRLARYSNPNVGIYEPGEKYYFDSYFTEKTLKALDDRDKNKPLFLSAMFVAPHPPLEIPQPWFDCIKDDDVLLPDNVGVFYKYQSPLQLYNLTGMIGSHYSRQEWKESWRVYLGLVAFLDNLVGRIINKLKKEGIYDDSLIIFTSDHGEMLGSHSLYQKMCMYEESSKVPLIMKFPKSDLNKNGIIDSPVSLIDVVPTLAEYFSLVHKTEFDGRSLIPLIKGEEKTYDRTIFIQYDGNGARSNFQRCVIKDGYKLIVDLFKDEYYLELYYTNEDKEEKENLIFKDDSLDEFLYQLIDSLDSHMRNSGDLIQLPRIDIASFRSKYKTLGARQIL